MKQPPSPHTNTYWLCPDGQHVNGPFSMTQILAMHQLAPLAPDMPMRLEGTDSWATVADWLPAVVPPSPRAQARSRDSAAASSPDSQTIPPWMLLSALGLAVVGVVYYFLVL